MDILADQGADSLAQLFAGLDSTRPVAVITEGLVNYFELAVIEGFWSRLATQLQRFPQAIYLTELYPDLQEHPRYRQLRWGVELVGRLTRGNYSLHYRNCRGDCCRLCPLRLYLYRGVRSCSASHGFGLGQRCRRPACAGD